MRAVLLAVIALLLVSAPAIAKLSESEQREYIESIASCLGLYLYVEHHVDAKSSVSDADAQLLELFRAQIAPDMLSQVLWAHLHDEKSYFATLQAGVNRAGDLASTKEVQDAGLQCFALQMIIRVREKHVISE